MTPILAQAESVFLLSVYKPVIAAALLTGWGWVVMHLDKDAAHYLLPRTLWNGALLGVGGALGAVVARRLLAQWLHLPTRWLLAAGYAGLALLTLASPFWFIVPHLTP